jgi:hypothetical protein
MIHLALFLGAWFILSCVCGSWIGGRLKEMSGEDQAEDQLSPPATTARRDPSIQASARSRGLRLVELAD